MISDEMPHTIEPFADSVHVRRDKARPDRVACMP
jgi:hypothetical protein